MNNNDNYFTPCSRDTFRRVTIPSCLGDDKGEYAPKNGDYNNAIVFYEANNAVYIYSSDGIPTKVSASLDKLKALAYKDQADYMTDVTNKPTIPTKTSDITNDSGFITSSYHDSTKQNTLTAGQNITIENNVISATGGTSLTMFQEYDNTEEKAKYAIMGSYGATDPNGGALWFVDNYGTENTSNGITTINIDEVSIEADESIDLSSDGTWVSLKSSDGVSIGTEGKSITLQAEGGGADAKAYYTKTSSSSRLPSEEIATVGDLSSKQNALDYYKEFVLSGDRYIEIGDYDLEEDTGSALFLINNNYGSTLTSVLDFIELNSNHDISINTVSELRLNVESGDCFINVPTNKKAYYKKGIGSAEPTDEIATKGDINNLITQINAATGSNIPLLS